MILESAESLFRGYPPHLKTRSKLKPPYVSVVTSASLKLTQYKGLFSLSINTLNVAPVLIVHHTYTQDQRLKSTSTCRLSLHDSSYAI